jgi:hypothetical protein
VTHRAGRLLTRIDRAGGGLAADFLLYALSAAFALVTARTSTLLPHRAWGSIAFWAYLAAVLVAVQLTGWRRAVLPAYAETGARAALTWLTWAAAGLLPLIVEATQRAGGRTDRAQDEVLVVEQMGERLLHSGTPYLGRDAILALPSGERLGAYSPYQPGMAIFGLPRAIFGDFWWTDARVWFAVVTVGALAGAVSIMRRSSVRVRAIQVATVLPICALTLATGGDDLPVLALCLLALALAGSGRFGWAGAAVGAAAAAKLFAFPVVAVLIALAVTLARRPPGESPIVGPENPASRRSLRLLVGALGLPVLVLIPPLLVNSDGVVENVLRFPLGHGVVPSPAQSPFPGYLIAQHLPGGRYIAAVLLVAVAAAIGVRLLRHPPRTATGAAVLSGCGLLAAILLMPTTRFGYLLYPAAFLVWAPALRRPTAESVPHSDPALYRR